VESLALLALRDVGPWVFVGLSVWFGWLIPRSTHRERVADLRAAIAAQEKTLAERDRQIGILLGLRGKEPEPPS
jgi:hypothetical protein